jgi:ACS family tartrate transporter-like MFS transporter
MPQIIKALGTLTNFEVSLLNALPALFGLVALVLWARHSDRTGERGWHSAIPQFVTAAGLLASGWFASPSLAMAALVVAGIGIYGFIGVFYTMAPDYLSAGNAAGGIALVTTLGNVGGFVGPYAVGLMRDAFGDFHYALFACALCFVAGGIMAAIVGARSRMTLRPPQPKSIGGFG